MAAQPVRDSSPNTHSKERESSMPSTLETLVFVSTAFLQLDKCAPLSPGTSKSLKTLVGHITTLYHKSGTSESLLPDKESIPPNKKRTWQETTERMGVTQWKRRRHTSSSSPERSATTRIGNLNRKKPHVKNTDPYSGGLRSGKHAAPDAQTVAQNVASRAAAATPAAATRPALAPIPWYTASQSAGPSATALQVPGSTHRWYPVPASLPNAQCVPSATTATAPSQVPASTRSYPIPAPTSTRLYPVPTAFPSNNSYSYNALYPTYWPYGHFSADYTRRPQ